MFRFSLFIGVSLIVGISAKPSKPWNKFTDETFQDTVMSIDKDGKMSWGVEVEPPEDLDEIHYDVNPSMKIWKSMTGVGQAPKHMKAEVNLDELYHPSVVDLLTVQTQNKDVLPAEEVPAKFVQAEEDKDDVAHPDFEVVQEEAEQEWDEDKAREEVARYMAPFMKGAEGKALYSEPEKDMDDLYHKDVPELVFHQDDAEPAAALVDLPFQRKHSEPEEDLDDIFHK